MATKLDKMVICIDRLLPIKSYDSLNTWYCKITWIIKISNLTWWAPAHKLTWPFRLWSCEITWQSEIIVSLVPQCLWPPNVASWWLAMRSFNSWCYSTLWSRNVARSHDKLKLLYLHYQNVLGHKTRQDGAFYHKVTWPYNHGILQDHLTY